VDRGQGAGGGAGDFGVYLVGRDLEQGFVAFDRVADLLDPAHHGAFRDGLAHLGHDDVDRHIGILSIRPTA
jgi:hypothetical protein